MGKFSHESDPSLPCTNTVQVLLYRTVRHMRDGGAHCPGTVREFTKTRPGASNEGLGRGTHQPPQEDPKCLIRPRCHGNGPRCVRIMQRGGDPATAAPAWGSLFRRHESAAVRSWTILLCGPRGPVMGCIACAAKAHPDKAPRGAQYHIQQASRRTVCWLVVESVRSVKL